MSDVATSYKCHRQERPVSKSGDNAAAKNTTSPKRTTGWLPGSFRAGVIRFAQFESGIFAHLRGVFGRRRVTTTNRDEY